MPRRQPASPAAVLPTYVYIYPGLLLRAGPDALSLDRRCPASLYSACGAGTCVICLEDFHDKDIVRSLPCAATHVFHSRCVLTWLVGGAERCPLCNQGVEGERFLGPLRRVPWLEKERLAGGTLAETRASRAYCCIVYDRVRIELNHVVVAK